MKRFILTGLLACPCLVVTAPAFAADALKFGAVPAWVFPQVAPRSPVKPSDAPVALLLADEQLRLEPGRIIRFTELAIKIQKPEGLSAGNLSLAWNPATETLTVHRILVRRGDKVIDVLASGQKFTTMRREANLDQAMLDGVLTANLQPEDLQEGDIISVASTIEHVDPTLKDHVETGFASWNNLPIALAHARLHWPATMPLVVRQSGGLQSVEPVLRNGVKSIEIIARDVEPLIAPRGAPPRFAIGRIGEASDFKSWAEAADLLAPLYKAAAVIPAVGPLHDEVEKIRAGPSDPTKRTEAALLLVQNRVRYVALLMGVGGYKPASAAESWSRRFGDCKAKTALLLAILHSLGIEADAVAVRSRGGDFVADRLPMIAVFDHVLVRARVAGKTYWLDGTRSGDTRLAAIEVPDFRWGLPLVAKAELLPIVAPPLGRPEDDLALVIDASAGVHAPAPIQLEQTIRGDGATKLDLLIKTATEAQRRELFDRSWRKQFDFVTPGPTEVKFNPSTRTIRLTMTGSAKLDWSEGWFHMPNSSVGFTADWERAPGPLRNVPIAVGYPLFDRRVTTLKLPPGFFAQRKWKGDETVNETLAGYALTVTTTKVSTAAADVLTVETKSRSVQPEVPYTVALAAVPRLKELDDEDVAVPLPDSYRPTTADLAALGATTPQTAKAFFKRGLAFLNGGDFDRAIADFTQTIDRDPKDAWAFANRAVAYASAERAAEAVKDIDAAVLLDPSNGIALHARALVASLHDDPKAEVAALSESINRNSDDYWAVRRRAFARRETGDTPGALADSAAILKVTPIDSDLRVLRANLFTKTGDKSAIEQEARALERDASTDSYALVAAGKIYAYLGKQADAERTIDRALAMRPAAYIFLNRAAIRPRQDWQGRLRDFDAALKLEPKDRDALGSKADLLMERGNFGQAMTLLNDALRQVPADRYLLGQRAIASVRLGKLEQARADVASERKAAKGAEDHNAMCWNRATAGVLLEEAFEDCQKALELRPETASFLDSLGLVELRRGRLDAAIDAYTRAIGGNIGSSSLMGRAIAFARKGDTARAEADRAAAIKLDPKAEERFVRYGLKV